MEDELQMIKMELKDSEFQENEIEEFYENIQAPKFVDFTSPNHYCPDDRFWFCQRQGCDLKHEEETDSEEIYKNFVLRVMAARSPNVKLQKALNRNALSKTMRCPASAPPKSSKPRVSKLALISSLSRKLVNDKEDVIKPQPTITSSSTPKPKTKQVAAKYLTTPRNRKCLQDETSFRSVQHPKPEATASKERTVVKALVFHSPKKTIAIKTSVELKTPLSKLRSQKKPAGPLRKRVTFKEESSEKIKSGTRTEKTKGVSSSSPKILAKRIADKGPELTLTNPKPIESNLEEIASCTVPSSTLNSDLISLDVSRELETASNLKPIPAEEIDLPKLQVPIIVDALQGVGIESEVTDGDDKENDLPRGVVIASEATDGDDNRRLNKASSEARSKIMHNGRGKLNKADQLVDKSTKEGIISIKVKKPKSTNPKPFRFRTDERGILKEAANMEKNHATKTEPAKPSKEGNSKRKLAKDDKLQDRCSAKMPERKILAEVSSGETIQVAQEGAKSAAAMPKRLMQVRKTTSPVKQEIAQPEREAKSPARKLNVIKKTSSSGTRPRKTMDRKENTGATGNHQPSQKRLTVTIPKEPNLRTGHRLKSCAKQVV